MLGTKLKIVLGYEGVPDRLLAMDRGEIEGMCGMVMASVKASLGPRLKDGSLKLVAQAGLTKNPDYPHVPNMLDEATSPDARLALEFLFAQLQINIALAAPPGLPAARVASLRTAFEAMIVDSELLGDVRAAGLDFHPMDGEQTSEVVQRLFATPKQVVARVRAAVTAPPQQR
jgi:tripartite-type tricarboxylate transporter receptor subunit TctC